MTTSIGRGFLAVNKSSPLVDGKLSHNINDNHTVSIGYKYGASEKGTRAEWKFSAYSLSAYKYAGNSGIAGDSGVNFSVDVLELLYKNNKPSGTSLAASMRPKADGNSKQLLQESISRPVQLPSNFLVKVDPTAVSQIRVLNAAGAIASIENGAHIISIPIPGVVAGAAAAVVAIAINGNPIVNNGLFAMVGGQLSINTSNLPVPTNLDTYRITIDDGAGHNIDVTFDVENV